MSGEKSECIGSGNREGAAEYGVLCYYGTYNLGDAFQTYALSRLLPGHLKAVFREGMQEGIEADRNSRRTWVVNGFLSDPLPRTSANVVYAGIYLSGNIKAHCGILRAYEGIIGARDPFTRTLLKEHGVESEMAGCATLTLPRYDGPRKGELRIDVDGPRNLWQGISGNMSWRDQWTRTIERLELLKGAERVVTSRLHVALPCLAFGTPVTVPWITLRQVQQPDRLTLLDEIGFEYGKEMVLDVQPYARRYLDFLGKVLALPDGPVVKERSGEDCPAPIG